MQLDLSRNQLCGVTFEKGHGRGTYTAEGITVIADALRVNGGLIKLILARNMLEEEGTKAICEALEQNKTLKELDISGDSEGESNIGWTAGVEHVAKMLGVNGGLTALDLSYNYLEDEGVSAVCEAIQNNKETKLASLNFENNGIGPVGANAVAAMVAVTGGLTSLNLAGTTSVDGCWNDITGNVAQELATVVLSKPTLEIFCNIPIKKLRADSLSELDLSGKGVGVPGALVLANLLPVTGGLTALNLKSNHLGDEGVSAVCETIQSNKETKLASLNFGNNGIGPVGANAVAAMVAVTGALTSLDLSSNQLCGLDRYGRGTFTAEGITAIADALRVNGALTKMLLAKNKLGEEGTKFLCDALVGNNTLKELDLSGDNSFGGTVSNIGETAGAKHVAKMLLVNGALTALNLKSNHLGDEGISAVCEAIQSNKETKLASLDFGKNDIRLVGANAVAAMVAVTGTLTVTSLLGNDLDVESAKLLAEVAKQKGISLCGIKRDQTTADFSDEYLKPPDAILLASDLSQAIVTGALTMLSLTKNRLGEEGTKAICEALEQNTTLKELDISGGYDGNIGGSAGAKHVAKMLGVNSALTVTSLLGNDLDAESAKMLAEVAKQKGISLCGIQRDQTTADFSNKCLKLPDAILLASDLSQAVVTGTLTKIE